jgi:GntR family transcriptional regulator
VSKRSLGTELHIAELSVDRDAEIPIGVQLAWALRTRIQDGTLKPGQQLPPLREMAEATGVNVNTVKAVYQRLDGDGLIDSQQGSGTFVATASRAHSEVANIAAAAAHEARETGVDPRDVAAALYVSSEASARPLDAAAEQRRLLRRQIAVLERAISELEGEHPGVAPASLETSRGTGPELLGVEDLAEVRTKLIRRLASVQGAIDESATSGAEKPRSPAHQRGAQGTATAKTAKRPARPRPTTRPAAASG